MTVYRNNQLEVRSLHVPLSVKVSAQERLKRQLLQHRPYSGISAWSWTPLRRQPAGSTFFFLEPAPTGNDFSRPLVYRHLEPEAPGIPLVHVVQPDYRRSPSPISTSQPIHMWTIQKRIRLSFIFHSLDSFFLLLINIKDLEYSIPENTLGKKEMKSTGSATLEVVKGERLTAQLGWTGGLVHGNHW